MPFSRVPMRSAPDSVVPLASWARSCEPARWTLVMSIPAREAPFRLVPLRLVPFRLVPLRLVPFATTSALATAAPKMATMTIPMSVQCVRFMRLSIRSERAISRSDRIGADAHADGQVAQGRLDGLAVGAACRRRGEIEAATAGDELA